VSFRIRNTLILVCGVVLPDDGLGLHRNMSYCIGMCIVLDRLVDSNLIDMHGTTETLWNVNPV
jgi:hypothetical protein